MKQIFTFTYIALLLLLASCHKDATSSIGSGSVIVINEGNFGAHNNSDVSVYDPIKKTVSNNIFSLENGFTPGNVLQCLYLVGDTAFMVMNNSQKIVVANANQNFKYIGTINLPGSSPRFFLPVDGRRAYVTELYANKIWIVDYRADTLIKSIPVSGWTENLVSCGGRVYVQEQTTPGGSAVHAILMIDPATDQIVNYIPLASDPGSMALCANDKLFVLSPQQTSPLLNASIYRIDMASFSIEKKIDFSPTRIPNYIRYSSLANQILYADSGGIYTMQLIDSVIPVSPLVISQGWNIYGLDSNPVNGDIYISDAVDYQQASHIWRYSQSGTLVDHFAAGVISSGCVFR